MPIRKGNLKYRVPDGAMQNWFVVCNVADLALQTCSKLAELRQKHYKAAWLKPDFGKGITNLLG